MLLVVQRYSYLVYEYRTQHYELRTAVNTAVNTVTEMMERYHTYVRTYHAGIIFHLVPGARYHGSFILKKDPYPPDHVVMPFVMLLYV